MPTPVSTAASVPPQADGPQRRPRLRAPDVVAGALFAVAGAMFVASATASADGDLRVDGTGDLRTAISDRADELGDLQAEVDLLAQRVAQVRQDADPGPALEQLGEEIAQLAPVAGLTEVIGPGVTVVLNDADPPDPIPDGLTGDDYVVHQQDVQGVVNAFWRGGASGVTVMGQRLVSSSAVRCVGNTVILQGRVYSPPFVIEAVGDIAALEQALAEDEAVRLFREWSRVVGLGYQQRVSAELTLPAYTGPISPQYAQVSS